MKQKNPGQEGNTQGCNQGLHIECELECWLPAVHNVIEKNLNPICKSQHCVVIKNEDVQEFSMMTWELNCYL